MKKAILLIDEDTHVLQLLQSLLSTLDYTVFNATNELDGLELLKKHPIQVVIFDYSQSKQDANFLQKAKTLYPDTIRIVLSSSVDFKVIKEALNEGGIYKFINKPWKDDILLECVNEAFELAETNTSFKTTLSLFFERDALTGLCNRFSFYDLLNQVLLNAKHQQQRFAVIKIDIDRFSHINERLGEKYGDRVLQRVSKRLKKIIKNQQYLARMGNDEFVLIVAEEDLNDLDQLIEQLTLMIKKPMIIEGAKVYLTASMGISLYPEHGDSAELLMEHNRAALMLCKGLGGDQYRVYNVNMHKVNSAELALEMDLYQALERGELVLHYQPINTIDQLQVVGVEALLRWQHPRYGLLLPGRFLHFCEQTNLIVPIGEWVLRTACQQVKTWHDNGFPNLRLAVNLSARQLYHPGLFQSIIKILETTQFPPACLELEVTETLIMEHTDTVVPLLNALRELGIHLSLDDFGTGYSSLSYLRKLPFTSIKIDQSFVSEMCVSVIGDAIAETIIALGKRLGMKVVAEGVETQPQLAFLRAKQCDLMQGYLYSKPVAEQDFLPLLAKKRHH